MPAIKHEQTSIAELRQAHEARLRVLRLRAAREGQSVDPVVLTEIEDIEGKLSELTQTIEAVAQSPVSPEVADAIGPIGRHQLLMSHIIRLDGDVSDLKKAVDMLLNLRPWVLLGCVCGAVAFVISIALLVVTF